MLKYLSNTYRQLDGRKNMATMTVSQASKPSETLGVKFKPNLEPKTTSSSGTYSCAILDPEAYGDCGGAPHAPQNNGRTYYIKLSASWTRTGNETRSFLLRRFGMDVEKQATADTKAAFASAGYAIPAPVIQARQPISTKKKWARWGVAFLVVTTLNLWIQSPSTRRGTCGGGEYEHLMQEYMKHGNKGPKSPLRGKKAEQLFL
jgi:hypothetical protein